jgi:PEP-CTERM motif
LCGGVSYVQDPTPGATGVQFNPGLTGPGPQDVDLSFLVQTINGAATITDFDLRSNAVPIVNDTLEICTTRACSTVLFGPTPLTPANLAGLVINFPIPQASVFINDDVSIPTGSNGNISVLIKDVTQTVPEPASLAILGVSLLGMAAIRRRFRK